MPGPSDFNPGGPGNIFGFIPQNPGNVFSGGGHPADWQGGGWWNGGGNYFGGTGWGPGSGNWAGNPSSGVGILQDVPTGGGFGGSKPTGGTAGGSGGTGTGTPKPPATNPLAQMFSNLFINPAKTSWTGFRYF